MSTPLVVPEIAAPKETNSVANTARFNSPEVLAALYWLVRDTFRQAVATRIFWVMLVVSAACIVFCLGISVESGLAPRLAHDTELYTTDNQPFTGSNSTGSITLLYGFMRVQHTRHVEDGVHFIQTVLAGFVAGVLGFTLALVWTAGFVPDFLQPNSGTVLLAKPIPRGVLLAGKYLGVLAFLGFQVLVFFVGTWLALAVRTGVWDAAYLAAIPLFLLQFGVIFSFTVLLAVLTRSTVACIFGSVLFWLLCWGMNVGRHFTVGFEQLTGSTARLGAFSRGMVELGYWILPKPADIFVILEEVLGAGNYAMTLSRQSEIQHAFNAGYFYPELSILASVAFAVAMLVISARQLAQTDY
jgi:ABC-type transport system involved in multi-copper enzyme maturation permease subunit